MSATLGAYLDYVTEKPFEFIVVVNHWMAPVFQNVEILWITIQKFVWIQY